MVAGCADLHSRCARSVQWRSVCADRASDTLARKEAAVDFLQEGQNARAAMFVKSLARFVNDEKARFARDGGANKDELLLTLHGKKI
eukprot:2740702-Pleurochrysis_carterae.AAC.4